MGIENPHPHEGDPHAAFEQVATDFRNSISTLADLIGPSEVPPETQTAIDTLREKLHIYAPTH